MEPLWISQDGDIIGSTFLMWEIKVISRAQMVIQHKPDSTFENISKISTCNKIFVILHDLYVLISMYTQK